METDSVPVKTEKTVEVEPVEEGVRVKPKRQLTEAQLLILQKGREKLAEKRKAAKEAAIEAAKAEKEKEILQAESVIETADQSVIEAIEEVDEEQPIVPLCTII